MSVGFRIFALGDSALTVEFGNEISVELNERAIALSDYFESHPFPGFIETVPAYASTTIFFDIARVRVAFPAASTAFDAVRGLVDDALKNANQTQSNEPQMIEIPVHFDSGSALDLEYVAVTHDLSTCEVVDIFMSRVYRVYMLGFLPGFTYMADVDERIATPRKDTPRTAVPKGSVGIASRQTGIYSLESPGGWQIIGRTEIEMFTPAVERPTLFRPGDSVRFVPAK
ncbi:MAG TPA: 5-oxoprolinase subunit PxpB [Pyrinomonadaceae bacterium]|jgi:inhibitor of KinA